MPIIFYVRPASRMPHQGKWDAEHEGPAAEVGHWVAADTVRVIRGVARFVAGRVYFMWCAFRAAAARKGCTTMAIAATKPGHPVIRRRGFPACMR